MEGINPLPEDVRSSVRSGIILSDLTRVVEELVFNSLDAGATKVSVWVSIGTCYVKVVDDGAGISRDGLALLGERYATSKRHHTGDLDTANGTYGFRGEALASISDVSLLEVVTKAYGRPNGYRKVVKGSKCLYVGIDDDRRDVGTTVVVRDLFCNQPVRRKYTQSSPKKVLHSVKKCVLRIALVHPKVSFKVSDIESEDELLCTNPSTSPVPLLMSCFGMEDSSSLQALNFSDDMFKLSGYISGPCSNFPMKVFQYVYINSRFICKGPIHKLVNHLATKFEDLNLRKANSESQRGKKSKPLACPAYIVNLSCPQSLYDLTFEPSKTCAEFKDWVPILAFVEKAILQFWTKTTGYGESFLEATDIWKDENQQVPNIKCADDFPGNTSFAMKCGIQNHHTSLNFQSPHSKILSKGSTNSFHWEPEQNPFQELHKSISQLDGQLPEKEFIGHTHSGFQSLDSPLAKCTSNLPNPNFSMKCGIQNHQMSLDFQSPHSKIRKGSTNSFHWEPEQNPFQELHKSISQLDGQLPENEFIGHTHSVFQSLDSPHAKCTSNLSQRHHECYNSLMISDSDFLSTEDYSLRNMFTAAGIFNDHAEDHITSSTWWNKSREVEPDGPKESSFSFDFHEFSDDVEISNGVQNALLTSCSSEERLPLDRDMLESDEGLELQISDFKMRRKRAFPDDVDSISDINICNRRFDLFSRTLWEDGVSTEFALGPKGSEKLFPSNGELSDGENNFSCHAFTPIRHSSSYNSLKSDWSPLTFKTTAWNCTSKNALEGSSRPSKRANYGYCSDDEVVDCSSYEIINSHHDSCTAFCRKAPLDFQDHDSSLCEFRERHKQYNKISREHSDMVADKTGWLYMDSLGEDNMGMDKYQGLGYLKYHAHTSKARSMRSQSAPPFYREKKRFISLNNHSMKERGNVPGGGEMKLPHKASGVCNVQHAKKPSLPVVLTPYLRSAMKKEDIRQDVNNIHTDQKLEQSTFLQFNDTAPLQDVASVDIQDSTNSGSKWRNSIPQIANNHKTHDLHVSNNILNISSGFLHLAGDSLIPESITKSYLKDAKVLQQVDKKFIPVVSGGILAIIDQHAADERIRVEELREKVLSGEARKTIYLDAEQELVLPEIGYQLLDNYAEQIKDWGWICNIHAQDSRSFKKNMDLMHRRPAAVTLLAVPCVLGVNLSDVDLLEFIQQLSDTDGSSTIPPSVLRVLNTKACRGAIMFGDSLKPHECSLIVEGLKQTTLFFQCAHGRPTTIPVVNLDVLHKQIPKLGLSDDSSYKAWHGFCRHKLSLERTAQRLKSGS